MSNVASITTAWGTMLLPEPEETERFIRLLAGVSQKSCEQET